MCRPAVLDIFAVAKQTVCFLGKGQVLSFDGIDCFTVLVLKVLDDK